MGILADEKAAPQYLSAAGTVGLPDKGSGEATKLGR